MPRFTPLLTALLALAACNQPDTATPPPALPVAATPAPAAPPATAEVPAPMLVLRASGSTFEATAGTFGQLPAPVLPTPPYQEDSPHLARQSRVRRDGSRLLFTLDDGRQAQLQDVDRDDDSVTMHYYWGELPAAHQWVAQVGLWEGSAVALIDQRSGRIKYVWGQPYASPDNRHLLTTSADLEAGYNANGIQLFRVEADSLFLVGQREFQHHGPEQARWLNNHAVVLQMQGMQLGEGPFPSTYLGLDLTPDPATARR